MEISIRYAKVDKDILNGSMWMGDFMKKMVVVFLMTLILFGCDLLGHTRKDVNVVLSAVDRAINSSVEKGIEPEVQSKYINAATLKFTSADESTVNSMKVFFDTDTKKTSVNGECTFLNYRDNNTGYIINGDYTYNIKGISEHNNKTMHGEMAFAVTLTGGKISSMEMVTIIDKGNNFTYNLKVDGNEVDIKNWENVMDIVKSLNPKERIR